jgi:hypothetical protein
VIKIKSMKETQITSISTTKKVNLRRKSLLEVTPESRGVVAHVYQRFNL